MYLSRHGGEAPRLELSRKGIALTPAQRRIAAEVLRAANSVTGLWVRPCPLPGARAAGATSTPAGLVSTVLQQTASHWVLGAMKAKCGTR